MECINSRLILVKLTNEPEYVAGHNPGVDTKRRPMTMVFPGFWCWQHCHPPWTFLFTQAYRWNTLQYGYNYTSWRWHDNFCSYNHISCIMLDNSCCSSGCQTYDQSHWFRWLVDVDRGGESFHFQGFRWLRNRSWWLHGRDHSSYIVFLVGDLKQQRYHLKCKLVHWR